MSMSKELAAKIAGLIQDYEREATSHPIQLLQLAAREKVLPLCWDMGGAFVINADGDILSYPWDNTSQPEVVHDARVRNIALLQGSRRHPELKVLLSPKPFDAQTCSFCGGTGIAPYAVNTTESNILCYCGGLGWVP
jgi:hypothetical protein